jgi:hypothetical protein
MPAAPACSRWMAALERQIGQQAAYSVENLVSCVLGILPINQFVAENQS